MTTHEIDQRDARLLAQGSLDELFASYRPLLLARARNRGLTLAEAEDVVQNAMLRVFRELAAGKRHGVPIRVVFHMVLGWSVGDHKVDAFGEALPAEDLDGDGQPDDDLDGVLARDLVARMLTVLPPGDRRVCYLYLVQDMRPAEIAAHLGMTGNAVHQALHRIRRRLRAYDA